MFLHSLRKAIFTLVITFCVAACGLIPEIRVFLKEVDFEVDPQANRGGPFVCHIVVAYSGDLYTRLQGMDANGYFTGAEALEKTYKDSIEVFRFDMIPGRDKLAQPINVRSRTKSRGAFIFAKYSTPGKFMENIGRARKIVVRFKPHKMEVIPNANLDDLKEKLNLNGGFIDYVSNIG